MIGCLCFGCFAYKLIHDILGQRVVEQTNVIVAQLDGLQQKVRKVVPLVGLCRAQISRKPVAFLHHHDHMLGHAAK